MTEKTVHAHPKFHGLDKERSAATRVTLIGMVLDIALGLIKCIGGVLFHSQALLVDGIHSFSDAASDVLVIGVMKVSRQAPDDEHPYGHQRIETIGTMVLGSILIAVGGALAWDNILRMITGNVTEPPGWPVLVAAIVSVLGKEWIFRYTRHVGQLIRSDLIIANAWHSRTDAFSSVIVVFSTIGAMMGYLWLDALAAIIIAVIVGRIGWQFTWDSVKELVDTGLSPEDTKALREIALRTEGVRNVHELRSRKMGHDILLEVHLQVRPEISVSEGHHIGMQVVEGMRAELDNILDINFHIDAENDEELTPTSERLPGREEIRSLLAEHCDALPANSRIRLHYLRNKIHLELLFDLPFGDGAPTAEDLETPLSKFSWFGSLRIWYSAPHHHE